MYSARTHRTQTPHSLTRNASGFSDSSTWRNISSIAFTISPLPCVDDDDVFAGFSIDDGVLALRGFGPSIVCVFPEPVIVFFFRFIFVLW